MNKANLVLEDGKIFRGISIGKKGVTFGELCFNTGMTGYQEIFTDPSYSNQLVVFTNVHLGNYGVHENENESIKAQVNGIIVKNFEHQYSRQSAFGNVQSYLESNNIIGISDVDTREIVKYLRSKGAMMGAIINDGTDIDTVISKLKSVKSMSGLELASKVSTTTPYIYNNETEGTKLAVIDFGVKQKMLKNLSERGFVIKVYPAKTSFEEIEKWNPVGYFLSNGPGDPSAMSYAINTAKQVFNSKKPVFGICLGHQILCLAKGITTYKMHHGHRGLNHPVYNLETKKSEITSQNHGFSVSYEEAKLAVDVVKITHVNLNDDTLEGVRYIGENGFSVQYHPEASPGPHDSKYLFDDFKNLFRN